MSASAPSPSLSPACQGSALHGPSGAARLLGGYIMGSTWSVQLPPGQGPSHEVLHEAIVALLRSLMRQMDHWDVASHLTLFSRSARGSWHHVPPDFSAVLQAALHWARESRGVFDPTAAPVVAAWGFGPDIHPFSPPGGRAWQPPSPVVLQRARQQLGWQRVHMQALADGSAMLLQNGGVELNFSGIAKGYAVDAVAQLLQAHGCADFLVEIGGEIRASGHRRDGRPWQVAITPMSGAVHGQGPQCITLRNMAVATSGDLWHCHSHAGRRYPHTIDPRTGEPASNGLGSVTVLHESCMHADAIATTISVLGADEGLAFAQARGLAVLLRERIARPDAPGGEGFLVRTLRSSAFDALVQQGAVPVVADTADTADTVSVSSGTP